MIKLIRKILRFIFLPTIEKLIDVQDKREEKKLKSKIELCKDWVEELLLSTHIELDNVFVHNLGNWGLCGKSFLGYTRKTTSDGVTRHFMIPKCDKPYIFVPEIVDTWTVHAWIHEIGHYQLRHWNDADKPVYIKEYEAEQYSLWKAKECPHITAYMMIDIEIDARYYVYSHVIKAIKKGEITKDTMDEEVKDYLLESKYIAEEFDTQCAMAEYEFYRQVKKDLEMSN